MNDLQLGLIGLGGCAVVGVVAYNKWQEHRHRRLVEQAMPRDHADVLLDGAATERLESFREEEAYEAYAAVEPPFVAEPEIDIAPPSRAPAAAIGRMRHGERMEPVLAAADDDWADEAPVLVEEFVAPQAPAEPACDWQPASPPVTPPVTPPAPAAVAEAAAEPWSRVTVPTPEATPESVVSPAIDYVAAFELVEPVSGAQILDSQREVLARVSKPIGWAGYNDRTCQWERMVEEGNYRRLRIGLLLADRRGPLGEADLLTFHGAMLNLADELMAVADMPPREPALDAAIALDQFCANVDIQIGINVISKGQPFPGTKIRALAEAAGMVLDSSGRFVRCDDDGHVLYLLANQESAGFSAEAMKTMSTYGLVFILDVPCVSHGDRVFAQMLDLARRMADTLNGVLVDDNRRPLTESMLDPFRRQIGQYQSQLAAKGLPAGSPLTLRLFA
ncbi:MAG: cell division protein ZipA C-terminal FtsZ-binding domain-containing protein [Rhodocyclales bacterium]|nr:cell division protein ZipA C-terminal FtsZ-binding domain-containing protein [Rhodocyclales bacterium]